MYRTHLVLLLCLAALLSEAKAESGLASYTNYDSGSPGELTCAHRTRPIGSMITVSYGDHSIVCRVAGRGPLKRGRIIDLSLSAARALGMNRSGVVPVSLD
jgi:peptidoglycan lytic transglycosylase